MRGCGGRTPRARGASAATRTSATRRAERGKLRNARRKSTRQGHTRGAPRRTRLRRSATTLVNGISRLGRVAAKCIGASPTYSGCVRRH